MTNTAAYIISLIRALMQEQTVPPIPEGISLQELFVFSGKHSIEAPVFRALCPLITNPDDPVWQQWENRVNLLLAQSIVQLQERDDIIRKLTAAEIDVMPVKGCWLKEQYPDINDRQMSDLDMLIHPADAAAAEDIILRMGYRKDEVLSHHTLYLKPPYMALELHTALLPDMDEHEGYYRNIWEKALPVDGNPRLYRLSPEAEYLFYLVHLSKHLSDGGSGLRSILDNTIYARCFPNLDADYLERELKTLGLWELTQQVQELSRCWFETGAPIPEGLQPLAQAVCASGTYGSMTVRTRQRMDRLRETYRNPLICLLAYCIPRFFRPLPEMRRQYPILNKLPFLLPVFWFVRILSRMLLNKHAFWQKCRLVFREGGKHG